MKAKPAIPEPASKLNEVTSDTRCPFAPVRDYPECFEDCPDTAKCPILGRAEEVKETGPDTPTRKRVYNRKNPYVRGPAWYANQEKLRKVAAEKTARKRKS